MKSRNPEDRSMLELFRAEVETQVALLNHGLLELEHSPATPQAFATLMRAAHSLKGAARIVDLQGPVRIAHAMEDCFVAAQERKLPLGQQATDALLNAVDLLADLSKQSDASLASWTEDRAAELERVLEALSHLMPPGERPPSRSNALDSIPLAVTPLAGPPKSKSPSRPARPPPEEEPPFPLDTAPYGVSIRKPEPPERVLRLTAENLNRLLALAGESLVESRWLRPFADSLHQLKRHHLDVGQKLDGLREILQEKHLSERAKVCFNDLYHHLADSQQFLADRMQELDMFDRRSAYHSQRLYLEVLRTRMRPFSDGVRRFPRMVRDLARSLGKDVRLEVLGDNTQVDREILERLETPLAHLLRNAVDHGCEPRQERALTGKPAECSIRLEARHSAGMLLLTVTDDGPGVDLERVRNTIVHKRLALPEAAARLTESELLEFLFLPGFTLKDSVTEISGRGVGLDVVQNLVRSVRGAIRLNNQAGRGFRVQLQLPITLSVLRALLVEVAGEPYAIPLGQIIRAFKLSPSSIQSLEGRHHFHFGDQPVGLLTAHQVLDCPPPASVGEDLPVIVLGDRNARYGLVVDRFLGERELVIQPLDPRLGKVQDISAAALMEDGAPVLILDVEDVIRSIEKLASAHRLAPIPQPAAALPPPRTKRVLAVDDSLTVRELERKLLSSRGYQTDVAVDGMDAWQAVHANHYDLVIVDIDMPRMGGLELATLIKKDPGLKSLPVLIVSYKDRDEDRRRGLEAGADYYLTKGSFHYETLLQAVLDLIGEAKR